jgi:hypothetical protein
VEKFGWKTINSKNITTFVPLKFNNK